MRLRGTKLRRSIGALARWGTTLSTIALLALWIVGNWKNVGYTTPDLPSGSGTIYYIGGDDGTFSMIRRSDNLNAYAIAPRGFRVNDAGPWRWWHWPWLKDKQLVSTKFTARDTTVRLPGWVVCAPLLTISIVLWYRHLRRVAPGHCPCGYDLAGLPPAASVCPECGRSRDAKAVTA